MMSDIYFMISWNRVADGSQNIANMYLISFYVIIFARTAYIFTPQLKLSDLTRVNNKIREIPSANQFTSHCTP